jgi:DeoR family transcriptional regulator, fructose operon transcriptional repressor
METNSSTRRNEIIKMLTTEKDIKTSTLANHFGVTTETIRKDFLFLQKNGVIQKLHGRARIVTTSTDTPIDIRTFQMQNEKLLIAKKALEMVENNSLIFIDGGSTTLEIAKLLNQREGLVVITTSLIAASIVAKQNNTVYIASGFVEGALMIINGPFLFESIKQFKPVIAFMGTNGVLYHNGPSSKNYNDIDVKNAIVKNSSTSVVVCDSSKFHESGILQFADWDDIDYLITDSGIPAESKENIEKHTHVIIA